MKWLSLAVLGAVVSGSALAIQEPTVGSPAPKMKVVRWVKGGSVPEFAKGNVYVVEFWATWCAPCKRSIPHLTELAHKYKGKVTFIGVDVYDQAGEATDLSYIKKVKAFVDKQKDAMDYRVAVDGPDNAMATNWLKAFGEGGIPTSFVVDQEGRIAWIGHPQEGLDEAVAAVLAPGYDLKKAAEAYAAAKAEAAAKKPLKERFMDQFQKKNWQAARDLSDQMMASDPNAEMTYASTRFVVMLHTDPADAYAYARKISDGIYKNIPGALHGLVRIIAEEPDITDRDYDLALTLVQRAVDLTGGKEPRFLEGLAIVRDGRGESKLAVEAMNKAIALAEKDKTFSKFLLTEMRDRLAKYKAKKSDAEGV